jgi:hypothetical protein
VDSASSRKGDGNKNHHEILEVRRKKKIKVGGNKEATPRILVDERCLAASSLKVGAIGRAGTFLGLAAPPNATGPTIFFS